MFSFSGLGGGLDVQGIVEQILFVESEPIRQIESKISQFQTKVDAYNSLNSKVSALLSQLESLNNPESFAARSVTSSNTDILSASASSEAAPGNYQVQVNRLALFDSFASDTSFSSSNAAIGTGSFDLTVGSSTATITIDSTNNSLLGLRTAIEASGLAANVGIINDGSGYRLTVTSDESGSENAIAIDNNTLTLADGSTSLTFSRTHAIVDASELDASLTVNGLSVTSGSNQVEGVIEGVTLNLSGTSPSTISLAVSNDTDAVRTSIEDFVDAYNDAYSFINSQFQYSDFTGSSGVLAGDYLVRDIQQQLASIVSAAVAGLDGPLDNLAAAGVQLKNDGTLKIDDATLDSQLEESFDAVRRLFLATGDVSDLRIQFVGSSSETQAGEYQVDITQIPEQAMLTSPNTIAGTLGTDETLTITLGSNVSIVNLLSSMTIQEIIAAVNDQLSAAGIAVNASNDGSNALLLTAEAYGSSVAVSVVSDIDVGGTGFGTGGASDNGVDVAGTFTDISTSTIYSATGNGRELLGAEGPVSGLIVEFLGTATGTFGTVDVTIGYAETMQQLLESLTDSLEGPISGAIESTQSSIRSLEDDIANIEERLAIRESVLLEQFSRADEALQQLQFLQSSLGAQLDQLSQL
jgi:flagellar hook-associated protein 2